MECMADGWWILTPTILIKLQCTSCTSWFIIDTPFTILPMCTAVPSVSPVGTMYNNRTARVSGWTGEWGLGGEEGVDHSRTWVRDGGGWAGEWEWGGEEGGGLQNLGEGRWWMG